MKLKTGVTAMALAVALAYGGQFSMASTGAGTLQKSSAMTSSMATSGVTAQDKRVAVVGYVIAASVVTQETLTRSSLTITTSAGRLDDSAVVVATGVSGYVPDPASAMARSYNSLQTTAMYALSSSDAMGIRSAKKV